MWFYDEIFEASNCEKTKLELLRFTDCVLNGDKILEYCINEKGVFLSRNEDKSERELCSLALKELGNIKPLINNCFIEFHTREHIKGIGALPRSYGVHMRSTDNKHEIHEFINVIKDKLFKDSSFDSQKQQFLIENNIKYLMMLSPFFEKTCSCRCVGNYSTFFTFCGEDGTIVYFKGNDGLERDLYFGEFNIEFHKAMENTPKNQIRKIGQNILNFDDAIVRIALFTVSEINKNRAKLIDDEVKNSTPSRQIKRQRQRIGQSISTKYYMVDII